VVCDSVGWEAAAVWRVDTAANAIRCLDSYEDPAAGLPRLAAAAQHLALPAGTGLAGRVWSSGAPAWVEQLARAAPGPCSRVAVELGLRTACACPILLGKDVWGVFVFFSRLAQKLDVQL